MNSHEMSKFCKTITDVLWDTKAADELIDRAALEVSKVAKGNLDRDYIRTLPITDAIKNIKP
jgi:hypothetical protein